MDDFQASLLNGTMRDLRELLQMIRRADSLVDVQNWLGEREWTVERFCGATPTHPKGE